MAKLETLQDTFIGSRASIWTQFATGSATIAQTAGVVVATPPASTAGSNYGGYDSATTYDLTASYGVVQIPQAVNAITGSQQYFKLTADASNNIQFILENGTLNFQKTVATVQANLNAGVVFSAVTHAWWRIRESAGTTFWDTSPDGFNWTNQASITNPITLTALTAELAAGTYQSTVSPGVGKFDNFNIFPTTYSWPPRIPNRFVGPMALRNSFRVPYFPGTGIAPVVASITQVAATVTATGGTQTVATVRIVAIAQVAATITATGGTQTATTNSSNAQVAATITATGGTQSVATVNIVGITQVAATITASGGTQVIATVYKVAVSQIAGVITASGGTQTIATVNIVAISQVAATVTATGGTQAVASTQLVSISQVAGVLTVTGGTQTAVVLTNVALAQIAATITATGGTQLAFVPPVFTNLTVIIQSAVNSLLDSSATNVATLSSSDNIEDVNGSAPNITIESKTETTTLTSDSTERTL